MNDVFVYMFIFRKVTGDEALFAGRELPYTNPVYYCGCNENGTDSGPEVECSVTEVDDECIDTVSIAFFLNTISISGFYLLDDHSLKHQSTRVSH